MGPDNLRALGGKSRETAGDGGDGSMRPLAKNSSGVVAMVIKYACGVVAFIITSSKEKSLIGCKCLVIPMFLVG